MIVVTRTSRFTRGFVSVTKSAHALRVRGRHRFRADVAHCLFFPFLFPIPYLFDFPAGFAHFAKHPVLHPLLIPPLDRVDRVAVDEHREVEMVAAGQARHPRSGRSAGPS